MNKKTLKNKHFILLISLFFASFHLNAQIPATYYDDADGLWGDTLKTVLHNIIDNHISQSYSSLWTHFYSTDADSNGFVWDIYSDVPGGTPAYQYVLGTDQCGSGGYQTEGDCYNREHSFPKSWFGEAMPMNTDLFHLYPVDGYVNGMRSNYPYGETNNPSWVSTNGSKTGPCSYPGYSSVIFEPIDEYKGDLARTYFYMLTRYKGKIQNWNSPMLQADSLAVWAKNLLLDWATQDTVSQKEINRNDSIFKIQQNRNPFIDHPEYILYIWGGQKPQSADENLLNDSKLWYSEGQVRYSGVSAGYKIDISDINGRSIHQSILLSESGSISFDHQGVFFARISNCYSQSVYKIVTFN
jgi:endonuclease I